MYHYNPAAALDELKDETALPNPVQMRDMMLRAHLAPDNSLELNRLFVEYQQHFGKALRLGRELLSRLAEK